MTPNKTIERTQAYVVTGQGGENTLRIKTTAKAIDTTLRNPDHQLVALRTTPIHHVQLAFRTPPKKQTTGFQWHPSVPIETQAVNLLTNYFNQFKTLRLHGSIEIGSFGLLVKSVTTLTTVSFHACHVSNISERHAQIAPGVVVPFGHNLTRVVFTKSSLTHSLCLADVLASTAKDPAQLVIEINQPIVVAGDFKTITDQFNKLATGNWPPGLQMDIHKVCSTYLQDSQPGRKKIGQRLRALIPSLEAQMQLNSARFVATLEETADIRQAIIGLHPKRHCQRLRDIDRENAFRLYPGQSMWVMKNPMETFTDAPALDILATEVSKEESESLEDNEVDATKRSPDESRGANNGEGGDSRAPIILADPPRAAIPAVARASDALASSLKRAQLDTNNLSNPKKQKKMKEGKKKNP